LFWSRLSPSFSIFLSCKRERKKEKKDGQPSYVVHWKCGL
jgi:hypothetical protein